ncbi:MAG: helix-turn-helix domain-containing protein [Acidothermaceae bacterium]
MTTITDRIPELAEMLDALQPAHRSELEDAYLRVLATAPRRRPRSLHAAVRTHAPEVAAAAAARGLARELATRDQLVADSLSTPEVASLLGVSSAAVTKRRGKGGLIAFKHKEDWRYPRWQFDGSTVVPGAIAVWKVLPDRHDVAGLVRWFTLPSRQLGDRTPIRAIAEGAVDAAVEAASYVGSR